MSEERIGIVSSFIRQNLLADEDVELTPDTALLSEGLLDSLAVAMLAGFIEETFEVRFDDAEIRRHSRETVRDIVELIAKRS